MHSKKQLKTVSIPSESNDYYSNDDLYNIKSWGADLSFRELMIMYREGELEKPEIQRNYVWDKSEASRFIDSVLLGLPIPNIFLATTKRESRLIVDGYQRIMTIYDYVRGVFSKDNKVFKLTNTDKINSRWRGKAFSELADNEQRRINNTTIHAIIFEQTHPKDDDTSLYQVFERINTSGRTLFPQEIRNCVYQGALNTLLIELNSAVSWRHLLNSREHDSRMRDIEFILRFFALSSDDMRSRSRGRISIKKYLNDFMGCDSNNTEVSIDILRNKFTGMTDFVHEKIGRHAFSSTRDGDVFHFHPTVFDAISIASSYAINRGIAIPTDLSTRHESLLNNDEFKYLLRFETMVATNINRRIQLAANILFDISYE
ncbi:hypothetical protein NNJEOMEG_03294 [Fundidesulfovibrio magnetotacticus]|uniref:GmrSD restriction endonucleases N-terminal domain-containing protein n=1 Tax=Fundidesulfovibrio magnetotacticus TaxID=2730080 RepID=A0A6V8LXW1_9BACT|nr:DUF262 domain-containing protein [Fundidesulfovibrio magnetotacticus]GFK95431.1 hypothetical protein NNJEOMEG_03294 [Fundidesulfovibrio magnetotacticus]